MFKHLPVWVTAHLPIGVGQAINWSSVCLSPTCLCIQKNRLLAGIRSEHLAGEKCVSDLQREKFYSIPMKFCFKPILFPDFQVLLISHSPSSAASLTWWDTVHLCGWGNKKKKDDFHFTSPHPKLSAWAVEKQKQNSSFFCENTLSISAQLESGNRNELPLLQCRD